MNNKEKAYFIISKLDFNNLEVNAKPSVIIDNNKSVNLNWSVSEVSGGEIKETNGIKVLNFRTNNYKIFTTIPTNTNIKNDSIQFEANILIPNIKADNIFFNIGASSGTGFRFNIKNTFIGGFEIFYNNKKITFNYKFENNVNYHILVTKEYNVYSFYINGLIIGNCVSDDFNNSITLSGTSLNLTIGAKSSAYSTASDEFNGEISGVNISISPQKEYLKYNKSFTKYGENLVSRLNFGNIASTSSTTVFTPNLEAVTDSKMNWVYGNLTIKNEYGILDGTPFESNISNINTIYFTLNNNNKIYNVIELLSLNDNYKIIYTSNYQGEPEPDVVVNGNTTSALNFENGLNDKVSTTIWNKEGTANVTTVNKIFGENSFETKALGDSLYTNSKVITGGSTPFTIEFDVLLRNINNTIPLFTSCKSVNDGFQMLCVVNNLLKYDRGVGVGTLINQTGKIKLRYNEINKISMIFDGVCIRFFVNGMYDFSIGSLVGYNIDINVPYRFLDYLVPFNNYRLYASGIIDNINIHDGVATKVRDYDPYEDYLEVDLAFDGENNSTKIVDNAKRDYNRKSGYLALAVATWGDKTLPQYNKDEKTQSTWYENFSETIDIMSYTRAYNTTGNIKTNVAPTKTIDATSFFNSRLLLVVSSSTYLNNYGKMFLEFLDNDNNVIAAIKVDRATSGFGSTLEIGNTLDTVTTLSSVGSYPTANGYLDITENGIKYTPVNLEATTKYNEYFFNKDMSNLSKLRISSLEAYQTHYSGATGSPTGSSALVYLKKLDKWTANSTSKISTDKNFDGFSSLYLNGGSTIKLNEKLYLEQNDFTISFDLIMSTTNFSVSKTLFTVNTTDNSKKYYFGIYRGDSSLTIAQKRFTFIRNDWYGLDYSQIEKSITPNVLFGNSIVNNTTVPYRISIIRKNNTLMLYINGVLEDSTLATDSFNFENILIGGGDDNCYLKNFKIYKGVAVTPESPVGKIQLDFDNNLVDKYGNSTWSNNGVTFDQVNSVKGHAAYFDGNALGIKSGINNNLNFENKNFIIEFDFKAIELGRQYSSTIITSTQVGSYNSFSVSIPNGSTSISVNTTNDNMSDWGVSLFSVGTSTLSNDYRNIKISRFNNLFILKDNDVVRSIANINTTQSLFNLNGGNDTIIGTARNDLFGTKFKGYIDNFKSIKDYQENVVIDRPAVHLPLETNATNIGFTPLTINSVGNPTYTTIDGKKCIKFESGKYLTINSNNIFNLGTNSDFYIEFDFYIINHKSYGFLLCNNTAYNTSILFDVYLDASGKLYLRRGTTNFYISDFNISSGDIHTFNLYRKNSNLFLKIDEFDDISLPNQTINLSESNFTLGCSGWNNNDYLDGYMSNFKMFVGTSEIPETYNDKKVLDLDFKPTNKSYLFKDNNNKCVIHPVNITQRDYQDSQYCCSFNGTDQYLQLGKNDLFNMGNDDFVINIKFKFIERGVSGNFLMSGGMTANTSDYWYIQIRSPQSPNNPSKIEFVYRVDNNNVYSVVSNVTMVANTIYDAYFIRSGNTMKLVINDVIDNVESDLKLPQSFNLNANNNTYIGVNAYDKSTMIFNGIIYHVKVLRNTTDLSLLEEEQVIYESEEKFILTNGEEAEEILFTEIKERDIKVINDNDKITFKIDDNEVELAKTTEVDNIKLFDGYTSKIKDIRVYDIAIYDDDEFLGSELIDTQYPELEFYDDSDIQELQVIDVGEYVIKGFIEGGIDRKYIIRNKVENFDLLKGSGDYYYDGIDERYIDDYEIYEIESKQRYPLYKHEMKKGFISGSVNIANCGLKKGQKLKVYCYRNDTQRLIGEYELDDYNRYEIPNLDVNSKYDIIFKDESRKIENISSSYRTPKEY